MGSAISTPTFQAKEANITNAGGVSIATRPTITKLTSGTSQTYTVPTGVQWLRVRMVGGGGGGGGSAAGGTGGSTIFDGTTCAGGVGGGGADAGVNGSSGGTVTAGASCIFSMKGGNSTQANRTYNLMSLGGSTPLGVGGLSGSSTGLSSVPGSGYGFGGFGYTSAAAYGGAAGGAGGYAELIIKNLSATYTYSVGAAGAGQIGGAYDGGSGVIIIEEYYS